MSLERSLTAIIRAFEPDDAAGVSALIGRTLRISNAGDYPVDFLERIEASLSSAGLQALAEERVILVAVEGTTIVGTASLGKDQIHAVFVHPTRQRQGIGRALMDAAESKARERGHSVLHLYSSVSAVAFYEANGWRAVREHRDGQARLVVMAKRLAE